MPEYSFDENEIKKAFLKVKNEIMALKVELDENKGILEKLKNELSELKKEQKNIQNASKEGVSIGNDGVPKHILSMSEAHPKHILSMSEVYSKNSGYTLNSKDQKLQKEDYFTRLSILSYYEFKAFLIIYQLDEEFGRANYYEIASKLGVSYGTAGSYVSSLLKKRAPLIKTKLNKNKTVISIEPAFKALNLYQRLVDLYYHRFKFDSGALQSQLSEF